jgi:outer membrane protein assembly factor BamB
MRLNSKIPLLLVAGSLVLSACAGAALRSASSWPGLSTDGSNLYLAFNDAVYALDLESGGVRWKYPGQPERGRSFFAAPAVADDELIIVGDFSNQITGLRSVDGAALWGPIPLSDNGNERVVGAPTVAGDLVLVPSSDGRLYARNVSDGSPVWTFPSLAVEPLSEAIWSGALVTDDRVYVSSLDHRLYALNLQNGNALWGNPPDLSGAVADTPVLAGNSILIGSFGSQLVALDAESGRIRWAFDTSDWVWGAPAVGGEVAYFGDITGQLHAVSVDRGAEIWSGSIGGPVSASPVYANDIVYFVSESGLLLAREATTNNPVWQAEFEGQLLTDPLLVGDTLFVASNGGDPLLRAFDAESGATRWSFTP